MTKKTLLIISAHADDSLACAGTVFKLIKEQNFEALEVVITNSGLGQSFKSKEEKSQLSVANIRTLELKKANRFLGVKKTYQLKQPDLGLIYSQKLVFKLVKIIRFVKPQIIFLPGLYDAHPDHQAAYKIGLNAIKIAAMAINKNTLGSPVRVPLVLCSEGMLPIKSQILVDISRYLNKKIKLFLLFSSQASPRATAFVTSLATIRGYHLRRPESLSAEAFTLQEEFPIILFDKKNEPDIF